MLPMAIVAARIPIKILSELYSQSLLAKASLVRRPDAVARGALRRTPSSRCAAPRSRCCGWRTWSPSTRSRGASLLAASAQPLPHALAPCPTELARVRLPLLGREPNRVPGLSRSYAADASLPVDLTRHSWAHYVLCGRAPAAGHAGRGASAQHQCPARLRPARPQVQRRSRPPGRAVAAGARRRTGLHGGRTCAHRQRTVLLRSAGVRRVAGCHGLRGAAVAPGETRGTPNRPTRSAAHAHREDFPASRCEGGGQATLRADAG